MDEELMKMLNIKEDPKDEYVPGSAAPQIEQPEQKPEITHEPEQKPKHAPKREPKRPVYFVSTALTLAGIAVLAVGAFFLLTREVAIQQTKNEITQLSNKIERLYAERDSLYAEYNGSIDVATIRERATQYGMHEAENGQVVDLN